MTLPKVAFICTHNSCRSQIAEALGRALAADAFESCSAGTSIKSEINPDAVRLMRSLYGIDMPANGQHPKTLDQLPPIDVMVTMGCGVACPVLPARSREDWGLEDPTGKDDATFIATIHEIERDIRDLRSRVLAQQV
ncbi:ArsC family transcriptional regulator [Bifidobacterium thermophilum]|uniref:arsenate reductase ArsC n=1 Tax=Bifidobacterium thermophilum TaxID=33905 RepID=UPI000C701278|nr:arsenate reductase ArsC [Bifidobacterium thermophilum]PKU90001.1 ArsC family transcriptional regulator [Bifidobacterium thermophilum]